MLKSAATHTSVNDIKFVDSEWAFVFLCHPDIDDFWRELGGKSSEFPSNIKFVSDGEFLGVAEIHEDFFGVHIAVKRASRGRRAVDFGKTAIEFTKQATGLKTARARIQIDRPEAIFYSKLVGMVEYSRNKTHIFMEI